MPPRHLTDVFEHANRRVVTGILVLGTVVADVAHRNQGLSGQGGRGGFPLLSLLRQMTPDFRAFVVGAVAQLHGIHHAPKRDRAREKVVDFAQDVHGVGGVVGVPVAEGQGREREEFASSISIHAQRMHASSSTRRKSMRCFAI